MYLSITRDFAALNNLILELKDIHTYVGSKKVFNGLSLSLQAGVNTVILGPNGSGKTTLLRLLMHDIYPVASADCCFRLFGRELWNVWELRSRLGIVSHNLQNNIPGFSTGREVVLSGFHSSLGVWPNHEFSDKQLNTASEVMAQLELTHLAEREFSQFSTGEQRRLLLGRALVNDPSVLVLDEPTAGMDLKAAFRFMRIMRSFMKNGKTVIIVTHRIYEITPEISNVILLKDGNVFAEGKKEELISSSMLTRLYDIPVRVVRQNGFYQAVPEE